MEKVPGAFKARGTMPSGTGVLVSTPSHLSVVRCRWMLPVSKCMEGGKNRLPLVHDLCGRDAKLQKGSGGGILLLQEERQAGCSPPGRGWGDRDTPEPPLLFSKYSCITGLV